MTAPTVLIVDDDLGFIFWLGQHLDEAGLFALPAKNVPGALSLITEHKVVPDVLVVNTALERAAELIAYVRNLGQCVKIVGLLSQEGEGEAADVDTLRSRPAEFTKDAVLEWIRLLQGIVACKTR